MMQAIEIAIDQIKPNRYQPRKEFNPDALFELAQSIRENGLIQPIVVSPLDGAYEIIAGERRYRASILAGYTSIFCHIMDADAHQIAQLALIENIQREDLNPIEEAEAYVQLIRLRQWTQEKLAQVLGKSQSFVANKIRLLQLSEAVRSALHDHQITERHARALLAVNIEHQESVLAEVIKRKLNVAQTESYISIQDQAKIKKPKPKTKGLSRHLKIAKNTLQQAVSMIEKAGTKVSISEKENEDEVVFTISIKK